MVVVVFGPSLIQRSLPSEFTKENTHTAILGTREFGVYNVQAYLIEGDWKGRVPKCSHTMKNSPFVAYIAVGFRSESATCRGLWETD